MIFAQSFASWHPQDSSVCSCFPNIADLSDALLIHHRAAGFFLKHCTVAILLNFWESSAYL